MSVLNADESDCLVSVVNFDLEASLLLIGTTNSRWRSHTQGKETSYLVGLSSDCSSFYGDFGRCYSEKFSSLWPSSTVFEARTWEAL